MEIHVDRQIEYNPLEKQFNVHAHNTYEILCFLSGDADYYVEGTRYQLHRGDIMLMRKREFHHLIVKSNRKYERIVVNFELPFLSAFDPKGRLLEMFDDRSLGRYNHYSAALFPENHWEYYLNKMCGCSEMQQKAVYLLALLADLSECYDTVKTTATGERGESVSAIVRYINENIASDLSLDLLSERFYLSKTHLNRLFKQATGSTVWNYIVVKRLLRAREMIVSGENPTSVYMQCGFRDYTAFFRAYKKQFDVSPKNDLRQ